MPQRNEHLDVLKGFLVGVMIVYHALNYFTSADAAVYGYLRFVNGSFVFLSGYAIAFLQGEASLVNARRTVGRGVRLLVLFTGLNLLIGLLGLSSYRHAQFGVQSFLGDAYDVYVTGDSNTMAFRILAPIAYVVMLAPLYLVRTRLRPLIIAATLVVALVYTLSVDHTAPNVFFVLTGLSGLCAGVLSARRVANSSPWGWALIVSTLLAAVVAMNALSSNVLLYCVGISLVLKSVYDASQHLGTTSRPMQWLALAGAYSLLCYIAQIGFLHVSRVALRTIGLDLGLLLVPICVATAVFLVLLCRGIGLLRRRRPWANAAYRFVFG